MTLQLALYNYVTAIVALYNDIIGSTNEDVFSSPPIDIMAEREQVS